MTMTMRRKSEGNQVGLMSVIKCTICTIGIYLVSIYLRAIYLPRVTDFVSRNDFANCRDGKKDQAIYQYPKQVTELSELDTSLKCLLILRLPP